MALNLNRVVEYVFFFVLLAGSGYLVWTVLSPFISALALAVIIVTICYPLYEQIEKRVYRKNKTIAAAISTLVVVVAIILPLVFISSILVREVVSFYQALGAGNELALETHLVAIEQKVQIYLPDFDLNLTEQIKQSAEWFVGNIGSIFAGTVSTIFIVLISLFGSFYFFRDGREFLRILIKVSPLPDNEDSLILNRLAIAVRSVATGVLLVSLIQGTLAAIGFTFFGIERAVLWGAIGAILAMIPGVGTLAIMIPGIVFLFFTGSLFNAIGLLIWGLATVVIVDNIVGPYLMSRGNNLHPFIILISVLGGISTFGPIGFIVGPVIVTLFIVLLEIYNQYIVKDKRLSK
jgi:predicted PurR-regulated permease PerM